MENIQSIDSVLTILSNQALLQQGLDLMLKSSVIIGLTYMVATVFRNYLTNNSAHLLWMSCMLCIALLPMGMAVPGWFTFAFLDAGPISVITVNTRDAETVSPNMASWGSVIGLAYAVVVSLLLFRLVLAARALMRIEADSAFCSVESILLLSQRCCAALDITRPVAVKFSNDVTSPMSFGLLTPTVVLPLAAREWSDRTLEDVLLHELAHIKRLDWPSMIFCHVLTSLLWINPLLWFAKNRVNETAEQSCDAVVLRCGKDGVGYAEDLLRLARESVKNKQMPLLAQPMFEESNLTMRIRNILDGKLIGKASRAFVVGLTLSGLLVLSACSGVSLFGSNLADQEYLPTVAEPPLYPRRAADEGIEGWALVRFTVNEQGLVAENSVAVVDSEPAEIFNRASIRAAEKFEFQPRVHNGRARAVEGVQYLFRYNLEEENYQPEGQRPPPPARSKRN